MQLKSKKVIATLECVEGPYGTAEWEGIPLVAILTLAGLKSDVYDVVFHAADDYSDSLNLKEASADNILLAYKMKISPERYLTILDRFGYIDSMSLTRDFIKKAGKNRPYAVSVSSA